MRNRKETQEAAVSEMRNHCTEAVRDVTFRCLRQITLRAYNYNMLRRKIVWEDEVMLQENIRKYRKEKNMSQEELAVRLHVVRHGPVIIGLN